MVGHGGSSAGSYLADPTSPIPSHCASIVVTRTVRVNFLFFFACLHLSQFSLSFHHFVAVCFFLLRRWQKCFVNFLMPKVRFEPMMTWYIKNWAAQHGCATSKINRYVWINFSVKKDVYKRISLSQYTPNPIHPTQLGSSRNCTAPAIHPCSDSIDWVITQTVIPWRQ